MLHRKVRCGSRERQTATLEEEALTTAITNITAVTEKGRHTHSAFAFPFADVLSCRGLSDKSYRLDKDLI